MKKLLLLLVVIAFTLGTFLPVAEAAGPRAKNQTRATAGAKAGKKAKRKNHNKGHKKRHKHGRKHARKSAAITAPGTPA